MLNLLRIYPYLIVLLILEDVVGKIFPVGKIAVAYSYLVYLSIAFVCVSYFILNFKSLKRNCPYLVFTYCFLIVYVVAGWIKLLFVPTGLFPFFILQISTSFLAFGSCFIMMNETVQRRMLRLWWKFIPIIFVISFPLLEPSQYIRMLYFTTFFFLLLSFLSKKKKIIVVLAIAFLCIFGMQQRIDYIIVLIPLLLWVIYKYRIIKRGKAFFRPFVMLMILPLFFALLAKLQIFNVLNFESYVEGDYSTQAVGTLTDDTRTFLYEEAYSSAVKNNYWLWGRTPSYGYDSYWIKDQLDYGISQSALDVKGMMPQRGSEVFIVNMFTWCGVIGVFVFFLLYWKIGKLAVLRSNNRFMRVLGLYVGLYWLVSWISHPFFTLNLDYILLYFVMALICNPEMRSMREIELKRKLTLYLK